MADAVAEKRRGLIFQYKREGMWGIIRTDAGEFVWFNEGTSFDDAQLPPEGSWVEFDLQ